MSIEKVRDYFKGLGIENRILEFDVSSATVELAAKALNCEPCRIAKSITLKLNGSPLMIVAAGDVKIDNQKYKSTFGAKASMLSFEEVEPLIGHAVGGVCPFAVNKDVQIYLDESMKRFKTMFPACGSSNSAIELTLEELEKYSKFVKWVDVCKIAVTEQPISDENKELSEEKLNNVSGGRSRATKECPKCGCKAYNIETRVCSNCGYRSSIRR